MQIGFALIYHSLLNDLNLLFRYVKPRKVWKQAICTKRLMEEKNKKSYIFE